MAVLGGAESDHAGMGPGDVHVDLVVRFSGEFGRIESSLSNLLLIALPVLEIDPSKVATLVK